MKVETIEERMHAAAVRLAKAPPKGNAAASIEHCEAQCNYWRLATALAAVTMNDKRLDRASANAEAWEQRRGQAVKLAKADDLAECRRMFEEMTRSSLGFGELDG